ncbi:MAG: hypothetical protein KGK16_09745 [Bradyrhizobium sp.]|nr:hypothetical protein [Bradyrhizobium sp.]
MAETQAIVLQNGINEYVSRLSTLHTLFESANEDITRSEYETSGNGQDHRVRSITQFAWQFYLAVAREQERIK